MDLPSPGPATFVHEGWNNHDWAETNHLFYVPSKRSSVVNVVRLRRPPIHSPLTLLKFTSSLAPTVFSRVIYADAAPCIRGFQVIGHCQALVVSNIAIVEWNEACQWGVGYILFKLGYFRQGDPWTHTSSIQPSAAGTQALTPAMLLNSKVHHSAPASTPPQLCCLPPLKRSRKSS